VSKSFVCRSAPEAQASGGICFDASQHEQLVPEAIILPFTENDNPFLARIAVFSGKI
jgi:hypothetical protein